MPGPTSRPGCAGSPACGCPASSTCGWSAAITSDWEDNVAYRAYDLDPEHNRYRAQVVAVSTDVARVQFET